MSNFTFVTLHAIDPRIIIDHGIHFFNYILLQMMVILT